MKIDMTLDQVWVQWMVSRCFTYNSDLTFLNFGEYCRILQKHGNVRII